MRNGEIFLSEGVNLHIAMLLAEQQMIKQGQLSTLRPAFSNVGITAPSCQSVIESQIDGDAEGWEEETVVKLMNGQVWIRIEYLLRISLRIYA